MTVHAFREEGIAGKNRNTGYDGCDSDSGETPGFPVPESSPADLFVDVAEVEGWAKHGACLTRGPSAILADQRHISA